MSLFRPEAKAAILRWREAIIGLVVFALGLYWVTQTFGLIYWLGFPVTLAGVALIVIGVQRGRFRTGGGGPGLVQIIEGRISYFGPLTGGVVDVSNLTALRLDQGAKPPHWLLDQPGVPSLAIPTNAEGAEALFDAFATVPGLETGRLVAALNRKADHPIVIWRKGGALDSLPRLH